MCGCVRDRLEFLFVPATNALRCDTNEVHTDFAKVYAMDLPDALQASLMNLRQYWPDRWPGLWVVYQGCLARLGHTDPHKGHPTTAVLKCAKALAQWLERDGERRRLDGTEPQYHNRLHVADTLVGLTLLLEAQRSPGSPRSTAVHRHENLAMLAMLAHDLLHAGGINQYPAEIETRSVRALVPLMQRHGMRPQDQDLVIHLILKTDLQSVRASHALIAHRRFSVEDVDCLTVLVQEADVLASTLACTGEELTRSLAQEWVRSHPDMAASLVTVQGRLRFLEHVALFSSPASHLLGVPAMRQIQIDALRKCESALDGHEPVKAMRPLTLEPPHAPADPRGSLNAPSHPRRRGRIPSRRPFLQTS
jgi:hypothetical protein